jgi:dynein light chain 4
MAKIIKETMDRKYGPQWHCAIGEGFGFDVTYQQPNMIYVYYGKVGILLFKC